MKIALCFWGLTRSLKYTIESIKKNILQPLDDGNIEYKIFVHTFSLKTKYNNPRANENNMTLDFDEYKLLNPDFFEMEDQDEVKANIQIEKYRSLPDPWESNYVCLDNFVCAMYSKQQLGTMIHNSNIEFDYIVYLRPDLYYLVPFDIRYFSITNEYNVCTPNFHLFPKLNDRFCILHASNLDKYSGLFNYMYEYSRIYPLHSERFQYFMMTNQFKWSIRYIPIQFNRVRADGRELPDSAQYFKILKKRNKNMLHKNIDHMQHRTLKPVVQQTTPINATDIESKTTNNKKNIFPLFKRN
tara:strand:+ start:721 stop:1617 length:897 start_codon:yes stop_codon:yes gene_type:complete